MRYWIGLSAIAILTGLVYQNADFITETEHGESAGKDSISVVGKPRIVDGDTLKFPNVRVRFAKIDTCELSQPATTKFGQIDCGQWATKELIKLVSGNTITCTGSRYDRFERLIAECGTDQIPDLGTTMLSLGYAFPYREERLPKFVRNVIDEARQSSLGVWGFKSVEEPYKWRKNNRRK